MIRVPKDSLRKQLALAADYIVQLLGRVAELEAEIAAVKRACDLAMVDHAMSLRADGDARERAARAEGRTLIRYAAGIAGIVGVFVGALLWPY